ncbi:MAG TPA: hypothetical protein VGG74_12620 [Kofleriaceae bacterium]
MNEVVSGQTLEQERRSELAAHVIWKRDQLIDRNGDELGVREWSIRECDTLPEPPRAVPRVEHRDLAGSFVAGDPRRLPDEMVAALPAIDVRKIEPDRVRLDHCDTRRRGRRGNGSDFEHRRIAKPGERECAHDASLPPRRGLAIGRRSATPALKSSANCRSALCATLLHIHRISICWAHRRWRRPAHALESWIVNRQPQDGHVTHPSESA